MIKSKIVLFSIFLLFFNKATFSGMSDGIDTEDVVEDTNPYKDNIEAVEEGKLLWAKTGCYSCHGGKAEGGVGPSLTDDIWVFKPTDKTIFKTIAKGRSGTTMVGWEKELTKDEIWKIISYIRSLYSGSKSKIVW